MVGVLALMVLFAGTAHIGHRKVHTCRVTVSPLDFLFFRQELLHREMQVGAHGHILCISHVRG